MNTVTLLRILSVVALAAGVVMIVAGIVDFVGATSGWSPWVCLVTGILLVFFGIWQIIRPPAGARE